MTPLANRENWGRAEDTAGFVWAYYGPGDDAPWVLAQDDSLEEDTLP